MKNTSEVEARCFRLRTSGLFLLSVLALALMMAPSLWAQNYGGYSVVHSFAGAPDGLNPANDLVSDSQGNIYGTTASGGAFGSGMVYKLAPTGQETVLYSFTGIAGDGATPQGGLAVDAQGNLYGTTNFGGNPACASAPGKGCGIVFKMDPAGNETILYTFTGTGDGALPLGDLVRDEQGNLFGTATSGGHFEGGMVFKVDPAGVESVFYPLDGPRGLTADSAGNLYGVEGNGLFKLTPGGTFSFLHSFGGDGDGAGPNPQVGFDADGNVYGTTYAGGFRHKKRPIGSGIVFKLDPQGNETILHVFCLAPPKCLDGAFPQGGVIRDGSGNLIGTTSGGGGGGNGLLFVLDPAGNEGVLHLFKRPRNGAYHPATGLVRDPQGNLYGTTVYGGLNRAGTVYRITTSASREQRP